MPLNCTLTDGNRHIQFLQVTRPEGPGNSSQECIPRLKGSIGGSWQQPRTPTSVQARCLSADRLSPEECSQLSHLKREGRSRHVSQQLEIPLRITRLVVNINNQYLINKPVSQEVTVEKTNKISCFIQKYLAPKWEYGASRETDVEVRHTTCMF